MGKISELPQLTRLPYFTTEEDDMNKELTKQTLNSYPKHWTDKEKHDMHAYLTSLSTEGKVLGEKVILKAEDFYNTKWDAKEWTTEMRTQWQEKMFELGITWWGGNEVLLSNKIDYFYVAIKDSQYELQWDNSLLEFQSDKGTQKYFEDIFPKKFKGKVSSPEFTEYDDASMKARKLFEKCCKEYATSAQGMLNKALDKVSNMKPEELREAFILAGYTPICNKFPTEQEDDGEAFDYGEPPHYYGEIVVGVNKPLNIEYYYAKPLYQTMSENGRDIKVYGEIKTVDGEITRYFVDEDCKTSLGVEYFDDPYHPFVEDAVEHIDEGFEGLVYVEPEYPANYAQISVNKLSEEQKDFLKKNLKWSENPNDWIERDWLATGVNKITKDWFFTPHFYFDDKEISFNDIFKRKEDV